MGQRIVRQPIGADHAAVVLHDLAHVLLAHLKITGATGHQPLGGNCFGHPPFFGNGLQSAAGCFGMGSGPVDQDLDFAVGQIGTNDGGTRRVGVTVEMDGLCLAGGVDQTEKLVGPAPVAHASAFEVRYDERCLARPGDCKAFLQGLDDAIALVANVSGVDPASRAHCLR
jgi:hypothetical protein